METIISFLPLGGVFMADRVTLECTECKNRNYITFKNKKNTTERLKSTLLIKKQSNVV